MKKRSFSGNVGVGVFIAAFVCVCVAFGTPAWLVSDYRITGAKLDKLGLWTHCFRSLPNPQEMDAPRRFFVGCRWVYDPFTAGYSDIRGFLLPRKFLFSLIIPINTYKFIKVTCCHCITNLNFFVTAFMIATQFFFTLCFLLSMVSFVLILLFTLCCDPEQKRYVQLIMTIGSLLFVGGISGGLAVIIFACLGNTDGWMPGHANNFFGWSFIIAAVGSMWTIIAGVLLLVEANVQRKKREYLKESQTRFQLESRT